jgi:lipopolysaccharide/colanic/teichoic acid biosynthesis glycosyltransferase
MPMFRTYVEMPSEGLGVRAAELRSVARLARPAPWAVEEYAFKRVIDVVLAGAALIVSAPLWVAIAVAIKLEDRGPVFFTQPRWGRNGRSFRAYKFRSMAPTADDSVQALQHDDRITRVGRLLRATSLDELPQLVNIFRGDMSWVGPRALPMNERQQNEADDVPDHLVPGFDLRCAVRPGLTGIAQIFAPRDVPRRQKFRYDAFYIRRQSAWLDVRLIAISVWISLRLRWEDRGPKVGWLRRRRRLRSR